MCDEYDDDHDGHVSGIFEAQVELAAVKQRLARAEALLQGACLYLPFSEKAPILYYFRTRDAADSASDPA